MIRIRLLALIAPVAFLLSACGINAVPTAEERAKAEWANVEAAYQRRADLVPNLVRTVEGFADQEREVLTQVTQARAQATQVQVDPTDPQAMERFAAAQQQLGSSLSRLLVTVERYPDLRSSALFQDLQQQLESTENRINIARRDYNEAVRQYNTEIRTFPSVVAARVIYGAEPMVPFEAAEGAEQAPTVDFGNRQ